MLRNRSLFFAILSLGGMLSTMASVHAEAPVWAYPINPPDFKPRAEDNIPRRVADSNVTYSVTQLRDRFIAPVWRPDEQPPLPPIVAEGRKPNVYACGFCHRADGPGGPENASLAGLPKGYIIQQMQDYRSGVRTTSVAKRNVDLMIGLSKDITDAEIDAAADYFSSIKPRANIRVIEADTVPKTFVSSWHYATRAAQNRTSQKTGETEPIGARIVEMPDDLEQFENRDPRSTFTAYVPTGSVATGAALVNTGGNKTVPCAICHGADLKGLGNVPPLAGRSPTYLVRQLYDMQTSKRAGIGSQLMKAAVANLNNDDMVAIAAYLASKPR
jgi:cytochrome c553